MTTPRRPDHPGSESLSALVPAQRCASPAVHAPAQRSAPVSGVAAQHVVPSGPSVVGRDARLAVLWTLLGAIMGVLLLVVVAVLLAVF